MTRTDTGFSFHVSAPRGGSATRVVSFSRGRRFSCLFAENIFGTKEETNEYLDNSICGSTDRLAGRIHGVPRGGWSDSPSAGFRCDFADSAFCAGPTRRVRQADVSARLFKRERNCF